MASNLTTKSKKSESLRINISGSLSYASKAKLGRSGRRKVKRYGKESVSRLPSGQARPVQDIGGHAGSVVRTDREIWRSLWKKLLYERKMSRLVNHLTDTQRFYEEYVRLAQERDDKENRDRSSTNHVPIFNKRLFTTQGSVVITAEARRIMARNGRTRPDERIQPLVKAELLAMRSVVSGLKMVHQDRDYVKKALCHCLTFESYAAHQFIVKRPHEDCLSCYYIVRGEVEVTYDIKVTETKRVYQPNIIYSHGSGEFLGLVSPDGLSEDISPPATIYTKESCEFLRIDRTKFHRIIKDYDERFTEEKREFFSRKSCILSAMLPDSKEKILNKVSRQEFSCNREIIVQEEKSDYIYFVESGRCLLIRELFVPEADKIVSCVLGQCETGDFFGEECVLDDRPAHCTGTPTCPTVILKMHKTALEIVPKDHLHNIISKHRRDYPDDEDLRERGYRKTVWNNYKHAQIRQTLQESGNLKYLSRKNVPRVRKRPPTARIQFKENILDFVTRSSQLQSARTRSAAANRTNVAATTIRPWTSPTVSNRGEPDGAEAVTPSVQEDETGKHKTEEVIESVCKTSFDLPKTPDENSGKIPRDTIQRMIRESDPEELLHQMEGGSELGNQLRQLLQDTHKPEHLNGFTKTSVLVTMKTEDIVRKAKAQAEQTTDRSKTDKSTDTRDWCTVLQEENEKAKTMIAADKYRAAMLRRRLNALDHKRRRMKHERSWRALIPHDDVTPQKPKKYVLDELQEKYQGCSYNEASRKLGTITFSTVFLCKALTARHRRTKSDESVHLDIGKETDIQDNFPDTSKLNRPSSAEPESRNKDPWISDRVIEKQKQPSLLRERLKPPTVNNYILATKS